MFISFTKKLCENLFQYDFHIVPIANGETMLSEQSRLILFAKTVSPILYIIPIINADATNVTHVQPLLSNYLQSLEQNLSHYRCTRIICLNLFISRTLDDSNNQIFADALPPIGKILQVYWWVNLNENKIHCAKGSPDQLLNIQDLIQDAFCSSVQSSPPPSDTLSLTALEHQITASSAIINKTIPPVLTYTLIITNLGIWLLLAILDLQTSAVLLFGDNASAVFHQHQYYRMITAIFLHSGILHVGFNCISLYAFGPEIEQYYGRIPFLFLYFLSGLGGSLLSLLLQPFGYSIGASGAIYGLIGATLSICLITKRALGGLSFFDIGSLIIIGLAFGFVQPNIDNWGHIGGLLTGFLLSYPYLKWKSFRKNKNTIKS